MSDTDVAIFYRHDGRSISGGITLMGKIDSGVDVFANYDGSVQVTIELLTN